MQQHGFRFPSRATEKETEHTVSLIAPHLVRGQSVLDVGCGAGYVAWLLQQRFGCAVHATDIGDFRRVPLASFSQFDGLRLPFGDRQFDVVLLSFVLHHVPDVFKPLLLAEVRRVSRGKVLVLEDTPRGALDKLVSWWHGERFRRSIGSREPFGFLTGPQWGRLFANMGFEAQHVPLSRWSRSLLQPFARTFFVLSTKSGTPISLL